MEQNLINDDLIRQLCAVHDETLSKQKRTKESTPKLSNGTEENKGNTGESQTTPKLSNGTEENKGDTGESQTTWFASLGMFFSHRRIIILML